MGAYGIFLRTRDGGNSWTSRRQPARQSRQLSSLRLSRSPRAGTLLLAGEAGTLLRSLDGGNEWERIETPYSGSFFGAVASERWRPAGIRAAGQRVPVSMDEGASWTPVDTGDHRTLMCGTAGGRRLCHSCRRRRRGVAAATTLAPASASFPPKATRSTAASPTAPDGRVLLVGFGGISILAGSRQ